MNKVPLFLATPSPLNVVENDRVELYSKATGKPLPEITWSRAGATIKSDRNLKIKTSKDKARNEIESTLTINKVSIDDEDREYMVEASSVLGSVEHDFSIDGELTIDTK